jgi:hypothetical protein
MTATRTVHSITHGRSSPWSRQVIEVYRRVRD